MDNPDIRVNWFGRTNLGGFKRWHYFGFNRQSEATAFSEFRIPTSDFRLFPLPPSTTCPLSSVIQNLPSDIGQPSPDIDNDLVFPGPDILDGYLDEIFRLQHKTTGYGQITF